MAAVLQAALPSGYRVETSGDAEAMARTLARQRWDAIITTHGADANAALTCCRSLGSDASVIVFSEHAGDTAVIEWMRAGARDVVSSIARLPPVLEREIESTRTRRARKLAEQLKKEFIATVSHELRTPLTAMLGALSLIVRNPVESDASRRMLAMSLDNCRRLVRIVNDILDIEQMETGGIAFAIQPVELQALLAQVVQVNREAADTHHLSLHLDAGRDPVPVMTDPDRLTQVLTNILSNAIKFSPLGGEVAISLEETEGRAQISVRDQGPGIPAAYRTRIFEKFVQVEATDQRRRGGTGLGLSIARHIMTQLGGDIGFQTQDGAGTTFTVRLPAGPAAA